jgi:hypothetical protein
VKKATREKRRSAASVAASVKRMAEGKARKAAAAHAAASHDDGKRGL